MKTRLAALLLSALFLPGLAFGDPWKDESGHGRGRGEWRGWHGGGETPGWTRGRGYWDGHFRQAPPPVYGYRYYAPPIEYRRYAPPPAPPYAWEADREWRKEMREREKEARERWREWYDD